MPLPKRVVEPVHVARGTIPEHFPLPNELEAVTNGTLANTVRQLSSLSRHAEDLFGELARDTHILAARANNLQARIDRLAIKVTQLDSNVEEVSLQDIHMRKAFKSSVVFDQQVVSRDTMPSAMLETYRQCDKPPPLDKLNPYREDGKDGLKFYTDPNYFFDLWRQEMLKDTERMMHDRGKKPHRPRTEGGGGRHKKRVRQPHNTRERQRQIAVGHGEYIMPQNVHYRTPQPIQHPDEILLGTTIPDGRPPRPNSIELRRNYPDENQGTYSPNHAPQSPAEIHYRANYPQDYEDAYQQHYAQGQIICGDSYSTPTVQTPSRSNAARAASRPTQPPPAPPSSNNSNNSTPTVSSAVGTPTRGRSMSAGRETLPPPPPPPVESVATSGMNGPIPMHLIRTGGSQSGSPVLTSNHSTPTHSMSPPPSIQHNPAVVQQCYGGSSGNTPEPIVAKIVPSADGNDLPPPPPTPEQQKQTKDHVSPSPPPPLPQLQQTSLERTPTPDAIPPPPPPPPPPPASLPNGPLTTPVPHVSPPLVNGEVGKTQTKPQVISTSPPKLSPPKIIEVTANANTRNKAVTTPAAICDARCDLLKAIRDGIKLRKVEKIEQKEVERVTALHDVASILARRVAVEFSDSDSASESEYDSEGWEDETSA